MITPYISENEIIYSINEWNNEHFDHAWEYLGGFSMGRFELWDAYSFGLRKGGNITSKDGFDNDVDDADPDSHKIYKSIGKSVFLEPIFAVLVAITKDYVDDLKVDRVELLEAITMHKTLSVARLFDLIDKGIILWYNIANRAIDLRGIFLGLFLILSCHNNQNEGGSYKDQGYDRSEHNSEESLSLSWFQVFPVNKIWSFGLLCLEPFPNEPII